MQGTIFVQFSRIGILLPATWSSGTKWERRANTLRVDLQVHHK